MRITTRAGLSGVASLLAAGVLAGCGSSSAPPPEAASPSAGAVAGKALGTYTLPGNGPELLVTRESHPRGGSQLHLYVEPALTELTVAGGGPLLPFVATDTPPTSHLSTGCAPGALIVRTATATVPPGVVAAWDIRESRYRIRAGAAVRISTKLLARSVPARDLAHRYPDIAHGAVLAGCDR